MAFGDVVLTIKDDLLKEVKRVSEEVDALRAATSDLAIRAEGQRSQMWELINETAKKEGSPIPKFRNYKFDQKTGSVIDIGPAYRFGSRDAEEV